MSLTRILDILPAPLKDAAVTLQGTRMHRERRKGLYAMRRAEYVSYRRWPIAKLEELQRARLADLVDWATHRSPFYSMKYRQLSSSCLHDRPFLEKEELRQSLDQIVIGNRRELRPSYTGGTSGAGIVVFNDISSLQERTALTDQFWADHGFRLGRDRMAWFSGRNVVWRNDIVNHRYWRKNWCCRVRYYSTFHMDRCNLSYYVEDLNRFRPQFYSGFPSAIAELARYIESEGSPIAVYPRAIFTTSETLSEADRATIERVFRCPVRNQYASSEGAPWICECLAGSLHADITTGVFEVLNDDGQPALSGELVVTSFLVRETPLIRYRIGDRVTMSQLDKCPCGWEAPVVESVDGRQTDFIEIPGRGRVFSAQIGDCVKNVTSVHSFRVGVADGVLEVDLVADRERFEEAHRQLFIEKLHERVGDLEILLRYVEAIPRLPSGKHSVIRPK